MNYIDVNTPIELYDFMKENINYGFFSNYDKKTHRRVDMNDDKLYEELLFNTYCLQTSEELLNTKCGICYDQVELERKWFEEHGYKVFTYYTTFHNHCFLIFVDDHGYNWFERTIKEYNGIHTKSSLEDILDYYKCVQLRNETTSDLELYQYSDVKFHSGFYEFIHSIKNGK